MVDSIKSIDGFGPHYGHDPSAPHMRPSKTFNPDYILAVYIRFGPNGGAESPTFRHGYAKVDKAVNQRLAEQIMQKAKHDKTKDWINLGKEKTDRREVNFDRFTVECPTEMYIIIDDDHICFDDRKIAEADGDTNAYPNNMVRFTQWTVAKGKSLYFKEMSENRSFYGATLLDADDAGEFKGKKILMLENWYLDDHGKPISAGQQCEYSMNLHLLMQTASGGEIPIIVDPDTGNGQSNGPPAP